ncbi:MAG: hypothetical protein ACXAEU_08495 [Candidatus Hodarchaeales archaeon]
MGGYGSSYSYDTDDSVTKKSAASYNIDIGRTYEAKTAIPPPTGKVLITEARFPLVVAVDVTGSMSTLPSIIFEKLCILYNEAQFFLPNHLKEDFEISFAAIGDAYTDSSPIQVTDFGEGYELDSNIKSLHPEGGGGGQARESYELIAYFYAKHCEMPGNRREDPKPMLIIIGDEGYYSKINRQHVKILIGDDEPTDIITKKVFEELKVKFDVYILRVQYFDNKKERQIHEAWQKVLEPEKVILMKEPRRVVDTILGLIAAHVDQFNDFRERIEIRQTPEQVKQVYQSLHGVKEENRKYVFEFQKLICPHCGGALKKAPDYNKPTPCDHCEVLLVRI